MTVRLSLLLVGLAFAIAPARADHIVDFSDHTLAPNSYDNGSSGAGGFTSNGVFFNNTYHSDFGGYWSGWSLSNVNDTTTPGYTNQYAAYPGIAPTPTGTYAVAFDGGVNTSYINLYSGFNLESIAVTNTTYTYLSMLNGDQFAKKFSTGDFFHLTITGFDTLGATGNSLGSVTVNLANYTSSTDTPLSTWMTVDLSSMSNALSIGFTMSSSDNGQYGMNTPAYFALANVVPEPSSLVLIALGLTSLAVVRFRKKAQVVS